MRKKKFSTIELQLRRITGVERGTNGRNDPSYRRRLVVAADNMGDSDWEKLSPQTKQWFNDAVLAISNGYRIPNFYDLEGAKPDPRRFYRQGLTRAYEVALEMGYNTPTKKVYEQVTREGYSVSLSTLTIQLSAMRKVMRLLSDRGWLKEDVPRGRRKTARPKRRKPRKKILIPPSERAAVREALRKAAEEAKDRRAAQRAEERAREREERLRKKEQKDATGT